MAGGSGAPRVPRLRSRGVILIWVMVAAILVAGATWLAALASERASRAIEQELQYAGQATNIARAGLSDGLSWFRRQATQPVTVFLPRLDPLADPPVNDTDDPLLGIMRSFELSAMNQVWARYEVRTARVQDLTVTRGLTGVGRVWLLDSEGIVYLRRNAAVAYDVPPNRVLARVRLQTEIRRLGIVLPANAAICTSAPSLALFNNRSKVIGGIGIGCVYPAAVGVPTVQGQIQGTPAQSTVVPYRGAVTDVFGVTDTELRSMADVYTTDFTTLPNPLPDMKLLYISGNATFNAQRPLNGSGILVVNGNLTVAASSNSSFDGLIFVQNGNFHLNAPCLLRGSGVASSQVRLIGSGDYVEVDYDPAILSQVLQSIGQYRFAGPIWVVP